MMRSIIATLLFIMALTCSATAADSAALIAKIKAVGPEGAGSPEAATAWKQLSEQNNEAVIPVLIAMRGASPVAGNWLRSALDCITERATKSNQRLPIAELQKFLSDRDQAPKARRLAFELICNADSKAREVWLPKFIDDPAPELRYDAVQTAFDAAKKAPKEDAAAKTELLRLLSAARSFEQTEEIAKNLEERGEKPDLTAHFGFIKNWQVIGPFENADGKDFNKPYPPETKVVLSEEFTGKTEKVKWKHAASKEKYAPTDLNKVIGKHKNAIAYAYAEIDSPRDVEVEFRAASATGIKVFINGKEVMARECYHQGMTPDSHITAGKLQKGRNTILLKICQNDDKEPWSQEWQYQFRITDPSGAKAVIKEVTPGTEG